MIILFDLEIVCSAHFMRYDSWPGSSLEMPKAYSTQYSYVNYCNRLLLIIYVVLLAWVAFSSDSEVRSAWIFIPQSSSFHEIFDRINVQWLTKDWRMSIERKTWKYVNLWYVNAWLINASLMRETLEKGPENASIFDQPLYVVGSSGQFVKTGYQ